MMKEITSSNTHNVLSPHPIRAVNPNGQDVLHYLTMQIPNPEEGQTLIAFHSQNAQGFVPAGFGYGLHAVYNENFNNGYEIPYGVPFENQNSYSHYSYDHTVYYNKNMLPVELDLYPIEEHDQLGGVWMEGFSSNASTVAAAANVGQFVRGLDINEAAASENDLDLTLRL